MQSLKPLVCVIAVAVLFLASGRQAEARYVAQDTLRAVVADTLAAADSLMTADTARKGMLEMPAFSTAVDSVIEDFRRGGR